MVRLVALHLLLGIPNGPLLLARQLMEVANMHHYLLVVVLATLLRFMIQVVDFQQLYLRLLESRYMEVSQ
jgi:hypothetical protein